MTQLAPRTNRLAALHGANVRRLMARMNMTVRDVVDTTGLDGRTVRSLLSGVARPHARTLYKLAQGLGVSTDELFQDPHQVAGESRERAAFDRATNPAVADVVAERPELFGNWSAGDFEELFSRMGVGGELTQAGAAQAAEAMNTRRELLTRVAVLLETDQADLLAEFVDMLYRRTVVTE